MEERREFVVGDCVKLKYGGPQMTVSAYLSGEVVCQWVADGKKLEALFREASLVLCSEEEK
jgi:uncharacterized protein YodC (DUF2158 family)